MFLFADINILIDCKVFALLKKILAVYKIYSCLLLLSNFYKGAGLEKKLEIKYQIMGQIP